MAPGLTSLPVPRQTGKAGFGVWEIGFGDPGYPIHDPIPETPHPKPPACAVADSLQRGESVHGTRQNEGGMKWLL